MINLDLKLFAMNVPDDLPHKTRAMEIEELPKYLGVNVAATKGVSFVNVGSDIPTPENSVYPWLRLDSNGLPLGFYVLVNSTWTPVPIGGVIGLVAGDLTVTPATAVWAGGSVYNLIASGGMPPYIWTVVYAGYAGSLVVSGNNDSHFSLTATAGNQQQVVVQDQNGSIATATFSV